MMLQDFRNLVDYGVRRALEQDGHHKPYEGRTTYTVVLPPVLDVGAPEQHVLELSCYVLGPARHYRWSAETAEVLFSLAARDVKQWIRDLEDEL